MELIDFILHVDDHLLEFITNYGIWIYAILFLIIFVETGLVVMPFLPGDSLLFAAGALAASTGAMDPWVLIPLLFVAAVLGDTLNYILVNILVLGFSRSNRALSIKNTYWRLSNSLPDMVVRPLFLRVLFLLPVHLHPSSPVLAA